MSRIEKWLGLDEVARPERAPLWKRAAWHAAKTLLRKHPGAVVSAAGAGAGYAVKHGVAEGAEAVRDKLEDVRVALTPNAERTGPEVGVGIVEGEFVVHRDATNTNDNFGQLHPLSEKEKADLLESLKPADRRALTELARKH